MPPVGGARRRRVQAEGISIDGSSVRRSGLPFAGAMAVVLALALVGCSEPEPEEVIRAGRVPPGDTWCRLLDDDQLQMLLGDVDRERVRQVKDVNPRGGTSQRCLVVWADGDVPVWVATVWAWSRPGGRGSSTRSPGCAACSARTANDSPPVR